MTGAILAAALSLMALVNPGDDAEDSRVNWCGDARVTGYLRSIGPFTYDGTPTWTPEPLAAASWDVKMGSMVDVHEIGTFRVADRGGGLGNGSPYTHIDIAVWSRAEAYALTGIRRVCIRRPRS